MADKLNQVAIRMVKQPPLYSDMPMSNPEAAIQVMSDFLSQMDRELFCIVNLQADLKPINMNIVSAGCLNEALAHPREIMKTAILSNANSMMLFHNHPSGTVTPSEIDIRSTARLQEVGTLMGIPLTDHIIVGKGQEYYSFKEKDVLPVPRLSFSDDLDSIQLGKVADAENIYEAVSTKTTPLPVQGKDLDSIMKSLESGVEDFFTSEKYGEYLKTMTKFHRYSFNNTLLIAMQRPEATLVTGYRNWQSMGRQVKKGEKGITILAPAPKKQKKAQALYDQNQMPILDEHGNQKYEEVEVVIPRFRATTVFDIDQTEGDPIHTIAPEELTAAVEDFDLFMEAITAISAVPIRFDEIEGSAKGYYDNASKEIVIQKGMSDSQTIKTAIHECGHAKLHDRDLMKAAGVKKDRETKEVEAESVAYSVCSAFQIETSDYSFPYIAGWSSGRDMKELRTSMDTIRQTAGEMLDELTEKLQQLIEERKLSMNVAEQNMDYGNLDNSSCISFYVAECSEFPVLGEFHHDLTLDEAFQVYDQIPGNRMNGIKSIGFNLQDGSDYEGMFDLYVGGNLQKEIINSIPMFRDNALVQKAVADVEKQLEKRQANMDKPDKNKGAVGKEIQKSKSQKRREGMSL